MSTHAAFSPSASERWIACPASFLRAAALPPAPSSSYAQRGTLLHEFAAVGVTESLKAMDEAVANHGATLEPDERAALAVYVKFCKGLRKGATMWRVEQVVRYNDELFGTIDFFALKGDTLHVVDFKGGAGIKVEAIDNSQLLTYAMMVLELIAVTPMAAIPKQVHLHIVQPLFVGDAPIRGASYSIEQMLRWRGKVLMAMQAAKAADAPFNPGAHCKFCPVKPQCPALLGLAGDLPAPTTQGSLSLPQLSEWLQKAEVVETWIAALREHAHGLASGGTTIPGWKLVDKRATRKWASEDAVLATAKKHKLHVQELQLLSPAQMEKKFREIPIVLRPLVTQQASGQNLVRDPAYVPEAPDSKPALDAALLNLQYRV